MMDVSKMGDWAMTTARKCDQCSEYATDTLDWVKVGYRSDAPTFPLTVGSPGNVTADLCSWRCAREFAARKAKRVRAVS